MPTLESLTSEAVQSSPPVSALPVLTIAGSDSSGGAGIQADLKTMTSLGVYGMSVVTALTAQNTRGVQVVYPLPSDFIKAQLHSVFSDIPPVAVKIGMLHDSDLIETIAAFLKESNAVNIVLDPVMSATSGDRLLSTTAVTSLKSRLFPLAHLITPNVTEAYYLWNKKITSDDDMEKCAVELSRQYNCSILIKGGDLEAQKSENRSDDVLVHDNTISWFKSTRITTNNTHGTGCTLSSAIASELAKGCSLTDAVSRAKEYVLGAIQSNAAIKLGSGNGPVNHMWKQKVQ